MLSYGFTASERTGYCGNAALCYREKRIYNTLTRDKRNVGRQLFLVRSAAPYGPLLHKLYGNNGAVVLFYFAYRIFNRVVALRKALHLAGNAYRHHYFVADNIGLLNKAELIARCHVCTDFGGDVKMPLFLSRE